MSKLPAPDSLDPAASLALGVRLLEAGKEDEARPYLERLDAARAPALQDDVKLHTARFVLAPTAEELRWLIARGAPTQTWYYPAISLCEQDAELRSTVRAALQNAVAHGSPVEASDYLQALAMLSEQEGGKDAPGLYLASARLLEQAVDADPRLGRAYGTGIADLYAEGGALDQATRVLTEAMTRYPGEFTWPYSLASLLLDQGKAAEALEYALAAQTASYGDNRLRAVRLVARVLAQQGRGREALTIIDEAVANAPKPAEGLDVRTHRYLQQLSDTRAEIEASLKP